MEFFLCFDAALSFLKFSFPVLLISSIEWVRVWHILQSFFCPFYFFVYPKGKTISNRVRIFHKDFLIQALQLQTLNSPWKVNKNVCLRDSFTWQILYSFDPLSFFQIQVFFECWNLSIYELKIARVFKIVVKEFMM